MAHDAGPSARCVHLVLFRPRPDLSPAARRAFADALLAACRTIPTVRRCHVGRRVTHGAGYEPAMTQAFPYVALLEFDAVDGLQTYLQHPAHDQLAVLFGEAVEAALVYDYAVRDVEDVAALLDAE